MAENKVTEWVRKELENTVVSYSSVEDPTSFTKEEIKNVKATESDWIIIELKDGRRLGYAHGLLNGREIDELVSWVESEEEKKGGTKKQS
jgi:hypothetical protein